MDNLIKVKFVVASPEGVNILQNLATACLQEKYANTLSKKTLLNYIDSRYDTQAIVIEFNDFTNQLLVVYINEEPVGYAIVKQKGTHPKQLDGLRIGYIEEFALLDKHLTGGAGQLLLEKCLAIFKSFDAVVSLQTQNSIIEVFKKSGFELSGTQKFVIADKEAEGNLLIKK